MSVGEISRLRVKIYADGAELDGIRALCADPVIKGFTTNPTLMRKAGIDNYERFARQALEIVDGKPISFEVFADRFDEMERQARKIASWGGNVYVKIPVTNTKGESAAPLVKVLSASRIKVNVTAVLTLDQVSTITASLAEKTPAIISVFAGRIADTGVDPIPLMREAVSIMRARPRVELIWASPRELLNIFHADAVGCHIITVTHDLLKKLSLVGKDLTAYSLDTVAMFFKDARDSGYSIRLD